MRTLVSVEEAREAVLGACSALPEETVPLERAWGRTLARDMVASQDVPPFANSAMDGFAVRADDHSAHECVLKIGGEIAAGGWSMHPIEPGTCVRIMTGAPVPPDTGLVVPVEWTAPAGPNEVRVVRMPPIGAHVRPAGQDVRRGETVMGKGEVLGTGGVGVLATLGFGSVPVRRTPGVAIVTTGDELVTPGSGPLRPGRIYNSNAVSLAAQAERAGGHVVGVYHAPDERDLLVEVIGKVRSADLVVFSGGVSMGRYDLVHEVLRQAGFEAEFWKVRQRPGNPLLFGTLGGVPVLGLPGNPVSSSICFDQYARPAIAALSGRREVLRRRWVARVERSFPKPVGLHVFARGVASQDEHANLVVRPTGDQGSNLFTSVLRADCLVHLPEPWDSAEPGREVEIEWLDW